MNDNTNHLGEGLAYLPPVLQKRSLKSKTKRHFKGTLARKPNCIQKQKELALWWSSNTWLVDKIPMRPKPGIKVSPSQVPACSNKKGGRNTRVTPLNWNLHLFQHQEHQLQKRTCQEAPSTKQIRR